MINLQNNTSKQHFKTTLQNNWLITSTSRHSLPSCQTPCYILTASKIWHSAQNTTTDSNTCQQHSMLHSHSQQSLALRTEHNNRQQHLSTTLHATFSQPAKSGTQHRTQQQTATPVNNTPCYILTASKVWHSELNTTTTKTATPVNNTAWRCLKSNFYQANNELCFACNMPISQCQGLQ